MDYDIQVKMTSWQIEISEMFTNSHKVKTRIYKAIKCKEVEEKNAKK